MVNKENIEKVISLIEIENNFFDMGMWGNEIALSYNYAETPPPKSEYTANVCGTPSCIGGWSEAVMKFERGDGINGGLTRDQEGVAEWLGLTYDQAEALFYPNSYANEEGEWVSPFYASREDSVKHLRHIIETGEVNWPKFYKG